MRIVTFVRSETSTTRETSYCPGLMSDRPKAQPVTEGPGPEKQPRQKSLSEWLTEKRHDDDEAESQQHKAPERQASGIVQVIGELGRPREPR
jgi:hypothetical protein